MVKLGGTKMDEPPRYRVIVDRISHEVEYYRGALKHAVLQGTYVINNPFWWTADDKFFNYSVMAKLGVAIPRTVLLPQKGYPTDVDITPESLHNLDYPIDWDGLLDYVGRPAILKPYSGGGWKHVYKVNDAKELLDAYDRTAPYCMTLQQFIDFDKYVRCFTFGKTDITPVAYDPRERRYLVEHDYLSSELGARIVRDAQTINLALGYEMNTIEFAIENDVPYAIDYLNPAPDFERDRITPFYFIARRREDGEAGDRSRAQRPSVAVLAAMGGDARHRAVRPASPAPRHRLSLALPTMRSDPELARPAAARSRADAGVLQAFAASMRERKLTFGDRVHCPFLRPFFLTDADEPRIRHRRPRRSPPPASASRRRRWSRRELFDALGITDAEERLIRHRAGIPHRQHRVEARRLPAAGHAPFRRIQRRIPGRAPATPSCWRAVRRARR